MKNEFLSFNELFPRFVAARLSPSPYRYLSGLVMTFGLSRFSYVRTADFRSFISLYGIYAFFKRQIPAYMFLQLPFAFFDYSEARFFFFVDYIAIMVLFATLGYFLFQWIGKKPGHRNLRWMMTPEERTTPASFAPRFSQNAPRFRSMHQAPFQNAPRKWEMHHAFSEMHQGNRENATLLSHSIKIVVLSHIRTVILIELPS